MNTLLVPSTCGLACKAGARAPRPADSKSQATKGNRANFVCVRLFPAFSATSAADDKRARVGVSFGVRVQTDTYTEIVDTAPSVFVAVQFVRREKGKRGTMAESLQVGNKTLSVTEMFQSSFVQYLV